MTGGVISLVLVPLVTFIYSAITGISLLQSLGDGLKFIWVISEKPWFPFIQTAILAYVLYLLIKWSDFHERKNQKVTEDKINKIVDERLGKYDERFDALFFHLVGEKKAERLKKFQEDLRFLKNKIRVMEEHVSNKNRANMGGYELEQNKRMYTQLSLSLAEEIGNRIPTELYRKTKKEMEIVGIIFSNKDETLKIVDYLLRKNSDEITKLGLAQAHKETHLSDLDY